MAPSKCCQAAKKYSGLVCQIRHYLRSRVSIWLLACQSIKQDILQNILWTHVRRTTFQHKNIPDTSGGVCHIAPRDPGLEQTLIMWYHKRYAPFNALYFRIQHIRKWQIITSFHGDFKWWYPIFLPWVSITSLDTNTLSNSKCAFSIQGIKAILFVS